VTLNQDDLRAVTTVIACPSFEKDRLWLNGKEEDVSASKRIQAVLKALRALATDQVRKARPPVRAEAAHPCVLQTLADGTVVSGSELASWPLHIVSSNSFPTAAGLASSAAGYACLSEWC
jgi:diphosphomevalonate decarboxylase